MKLLPILSVKEVSYRYDIRDPDYALSKISFDVIQGQWLTILGDNGSGKSTLARLIIGLAQPASGLIHYHGASVASDEHGRSGEKIGIVFQNPDNQFIGTTVQDDVAFGLENSNVPYTEMKQRVSHALKRVDMYELRTKDPSQLSGGQKQRVAIAGVLALDPKLMIFDEAFTMLDPRSRREILTLLKSIQKETNLTVISITHDPNETVFTDQILLLDSGRVIDHGDVRTVFDRNPGIQPPFAEQIRRKLEQKGVSVPKEYMSENELVTMLCE